jgi:Zn-dependent protease
MRTIIDIVLAVIFSVALGSGSLKAFNSIMKKEALIKVQGGLSSLENFTHKLTREN